MMNLLLGWEIGPFHGIYEARPSYPAVQTMAGQEFGFHTLWVL